MEVAPDNLQSWANRTKDKIICAGYRAPTNPAIYAGGRRNRRGTSSELIEAHPARIRLHKE